MVEFLMFIVILIILAIFAYPIVFIITKPEREAREMQEEAEKKRLEEAEAERKRLLIQQQQEEEEKAKAIVREQERKRKQEEQKRLYQEEQKRRDEQFKKEQEELALKEKQRQEEEKRTAILYKCYNDPETTRARRSLNLRLVANQFDPKRIFESDQDVEFSSTELYFLQYIHGMKVKEPPIAEYWFTEYAIDMSEVCTKAIQCGYLQACESIEGLTNENLKRILYVKGLPQTGRKADLIDRIYSNMSIQEASGIAKRVGINAETLQYILTEKGKQATELLPKSATKNLELEDRCISYIARGQASGAYSELLFSKEGQAIHDTERNRKFYGGPTGYSNIVQIMRFTDQFLSESLYPYKDLLKACVVYRDMRMLSTKDIPYLFCRLTNLGYEKIPVIMKYLLDYEHEFNIYKEYHLIKSLGKDSYKILYFSSESEENCAFCKSMSDTEYPLDEFEVGVTAPPFHDGCRCTIY